MIQLLLCTIPALVVAVCVIIICKPYKQFPPAIMRDTAEPYYPLIDLEQEILKIEAEKERRKPYIITLWLVFDGLRINADGSYEWVSRREKKPEPPKMRHACFVDSESEDEFALRLKIYNHKFRMAHECQMMLEKTDDPHTKEIIRLFKKELEVIAI